MNSSDKHNIIFFMVDQMGAKWLEAAMNGICELPNLKRLQSLGVSFSNAFSNNPVCCPARAGIATGLTSSGHGLLSNGYRLNPNIPTFMKTLQTAGGEPARSAKFTSIRSTRHTTRTRITGSTVGMWSIAPKTTAPASGTTGSQRSILNTTTQCW